MTELLYVDDETNTFCRGKVVHRQQDGSGEITVVDYASQRVLSFDDSHEQSRMDLDRPSVLVHEYTRAMLLGTIFTEVEHATLLGLGGGCLVRALHDLSDETMITAVEIRQAVADIAQQYFMLPESNRFQLSVTDAQHYLLNRGLEPTNIIFADMYHAYHISPFQMQERFVRLCHRNLTENGWLVINFHRLPDLDSAFFDCLNSMFEEVLICPVRNDNVIVYAGKQQLAKPLHTYSEKVEWLQQRLKTRFDLLFKSIVCFRDYNQYEELKGSIKGVRAL